MHEIKCVMCFLVPCRRSHLHKLFVFHYCAKDRKEWSALVHMSIIEFHAAIFRFVPVFCRTSLPRSGGLSPGMGGIPLHDAVGINVMVKSSHG